MALSDVSAELKRLNVPILILVRGRDISTPPTLSGEIQNGVSTSQLVVLPDSGYSAVNDEPVEFRR